MPAGFNFSSAGGGPQMFFSGSGGGDPFELFSRMFGSSGGFGGSDSDEDDGGGMGGHPFASMFSGRGGMGGGMPMGMRGMPMGFSGAGGPPAGKRARRSTPGELKVGTQVMIQGLQSASQHNRKYAQVTKFHEQKGRYTVTLLNDDTSLSVKRSNLAQIVPHCTLQDLSGQAQLNGQECTILGYNAEKERYAVSVGQKKIAIKPANVRLPVGTSVQITGLQSTAAQSLNGTYGTISSFDTTASRYVVKHKAGDKKLKPQNVLAV
jgi:hypothetical protein